MVPVRALMRMLAIASPQRTDLAAIGVLDFVDQLKQAGAAFFLAHPNLAARLQDMRKQDPRYLAHEYLNRDWHPLMFADVAGEMLEAKCRYIGSATLAENIDTFTVPANVAPMLAEARDPVMRETIRDFSCAQTFRRDVYRKGTIPVTAPEQQGLLDDLTVVGLGIPMPEAGPTFNAPMGAVTGKPEVYQPLFELLEAGPLSVRQARALPSYANRPLVEVVQAFTLLAAGGYAHPMLPDGGTEAGHEASRRLNLALARAVANAVDLPQLAAPAIGSSIRPDMLEVLVVGELAAGRPVDANALSGEVLAKLLRGGRSVQRDGQAISDPTEMMQGTDRCGDRNTGTAPAVTPPVGGGRLIFLRRKMGRARCLRSWFMSALTRPVQPTFNSGSRRQETACGSMAFATPTSGIPPRRTQSSQTGRRLAGWERGRTAGTIRRDPQLRTGCRSDLCGRHWPP